MQPVQLDSSNFCMIKKSKIMSKIYYQGLKLVTYNMQKSVQKCTRGAQYADLEFSRLESWSRDVSRPVFTSLVSVLVLEPQSLGLGLGLGTLESRSRSWFWNLGVLVLVLVLEPSSLGLFLGLGTCDHKDSVFVTDEA